ncbi:serine/threonine-protein kinase [Actinoplanes oblitus]|uniref:non-specific serine/threonine protein kinase n=1 Tax=Actinoplanes oblitus TaxID=3040509 RepID=A0ABY8WA79_9ACTN|nr:serine/threonine-protein kinase [Actinoplanes oblitus]WIM94731.1 serine/threonine-protein kinase [Actinoplanes oblitus]
MPDAGDALNARYRLDDRIAAGGMGEVWRATDTLLGRPVAVKMLLVEHAAEPTFQQRFEHEARAMATLRHPGVAAVYDYGTTAEGAYLVLARIDGQPLDRRIAERGRFSPAETMALVAQVAGALQAVHRAGIVHRDVTPGNLIIEPDGNVVLVDFGVARSALSVTLTGARNVIGTACYMAPEQVAKATVGPAADLYALGAVAYHCLTGHPPFEGDDAVSIALRHVTEEPQPLPGDLPEPVRALVARALAKDPADRHPSAAALAGAARSALGGRPDAAGLLATESATVAIQSAPPAPPAVILDRPPRTRLLLPVLAVLLAALSGAAAVTLVSDPFDWFPATPATTPAPTPAPPSGSPRPSPAPTPSKTISGTPTAENPPPTRPRTPRTRRSSRSPAPSSPSPPTSADPGGSGTTSEEPGNSEPAGGGPSGDS